jgi:hypothetical protein
MALTVSVSDLPNGTENRLDMRIGCYICFAFATIAIFARYGHFCCPRSMHLLTAQNICAYVYGTKNRP